MLFSIMPATPRLPGGCPPLLEVGVDEEDEFASEGSVSMASEGYGEGGTNTRCAMYKGIPSRGASGSKNGLKTETAKNH